MAPPTQVERAVHEAEFLRLHDPLSLAQLLTRYPRRPGTRAIQAVLDRGQVPTTIPHNELEDAVLDFAHRFGLPRPEMNVVLTVGGKTYEVDSLWRERRVFAERDGRAAHDTSAAFERDRARDRALTAAGWRVIRITWRALHEAPATLAADLRAILGFDPQTLVR